MVLLTTKNLLFTAKKGPETTYMIHIPLCRSQKLLCYLMALLYISELAISFVIRRKRTVNFQTQRLRQHLAADYTYNHVKVTQHSYLDFDYSGYHQKLMQ